MADLYTRRAALSAAISATTLAAPLSKALAKPASSNGSEIRIGQSVHLSGPYASGIGGALQGQQLAIEAVNQSGGIQGRQVRLITLDDEFNPLRCSNNVQTLIERDHVIAVTGLAGLANVQATLPIIMDRGIPLVGVYSGAPELRAKHHPYLFTTMASYLDEVKEIFRTLVTIRRQRVGVVYQNPPLLALAEAAALHQDIQLISRQALGSPTADPTEAINALARDDVQAVLLLAYGPPMIRFCKLARGRLNVPMYSFSVANSRAAIDALGSDARGLAFSTTVPYPWRHTSPLLLDFAQAMKRAGLAPDYDHLFGYLNMRVLMEACRRAAQDVTSTGLVNALEGMNKIDLGGYRLSYSPQNHHGSRFVELIILGPDGRYLR